MVTDFIGSIVVAVCIPIRLSPFPRLAHVPYGPRGVLLPMIVQTGGGIVTRSYESIRGVTTATCPLSSFHGSHSDAVVASDSCNACKSLRSTELRQPATTWLVVGDGDLSYGATIASALDPNEVRVIATVLEDETSHQTTYRNSTRNTMTIRGGLDASQPTTDMEEPRHEVRFGIDAKKLSDYFPPHSFHRIIFNFPHWPGKTNHRHNRLLLEGFLQACVEVMEPIHGEVHVALLKGQSGLEASSIVEWRDSWTVPMLANNAGLLLDRVEPFQVTYCLSSYRGVDRPFLMPTESPQRYVFRLPDSLPLELPKQPYVPQQGHRQHVDARSVHPREIDERFQMSCRHLLAVELDEERLIEAGYSSQCLVEGNLISDLLRSEGLPQGIHADIPIRAIKQIPQKHQSKNQHGDGDGNTTVLVCLVVYRGASRPLTRECAKMIRASLDNLVVTRLGLPLRSQHCFVSRPFPYRLILDEGLLDDFKP